MKTRLLTLLFVCLFAIVNTFAANRYWLASANATWAATTSWSATSGGAPGATAPTTGDDVFFETGAATTVTLGAAVTVNSITFTSRNVTFAGAFAITTNNMTVNGSQVVFVDYVTVNSALTFSGTDPRITQNSPTWGKHFKMGNGGAFTLTGNSPTNYFGGKTGTTGFVFDTTTPLTVYFSPTTQFGGITVIRGLITLGSNFNAIRITLNATNSQELIVGTGTTLTLSGSGSSTFTNALNGGVINASASGSKVLITSTAPTLLGNQSTGAPITGRIFKENSTIDSLEYNSTAVFYLPKVITVRTLTLTAGTINNSTNNITIPSGGNLVVAAGSTTTALNGCLPSAPTDVEATAGNTQASVAFTAPANGGSAILSYTVKASPGGRSATGSASPIVVTGLTNETAYTFTVTAQNDLGAGDASQVSNQVTPTFGLKIVLTPTPNGTEGSTAYSDESILEVNASTGSIYYYNSTANDDWTVAPVMTTIAGIKGKQFKVKMGGMATTNKTIGTSYGATATQGGIDRSSGGELGVVGGVSGGIGLNEGMWFGLDATNLPTSFYLQISKIKVRYARTCTGIAVNRTNTINSLTFGNGTIPSLVDGQGWIDVTKLNCVVKGGASIDNLLAVFNDKATNSTDNFRITGIELKILDNFDCAVIETVSHPRFLLKAGEESKITTLIAQSPAFEKIHNSILAECDLLLSQPAWAYVVDEYGYMADVGAIVKRMLYLCYGYRMTGNTNYLNKAIADLDNISGFPNTNAQSLSVCEFAFALGLGYDWLYPQLNPALRTKVQNSVVNFAIKPSANRAFWNMTSNWNQVCIGGLSFAAMAIYGDGTADMDAQAKGVVENILLKNTNSMNTYNNGNYSEGPMYWKYGTTYEVLMLSALESIYGSENALLNNYINTPGFLQSTQYMQYVTGTSYLVHSYADGVEGRNIAPAAFWMAKRLNDPSVLYLEKELMGMNSYTPLGSGDTHLPITLIYGKDVAIDNLAPPVSKIWEGNGLQPVFFVRTAWQGSTGHYVGIKAGTPHNSHAHMDGGSFVYDSQGMRWAMDFGKEDYNAMKDNDAAHFDIFRINNISHNTLSIKKSTETDWQHHVELGMTTIDETFDTPQRKGAKMNMTTTLGLNSELNAAFRTITVENDSSLKVVDNITNGSQSVDVYWNMATRALATVVDASTIKLTQGGKTVLLKVISSNLAVNFTLAENRSTDPVFYDTTATYQRKNPGTIMVGFTATIPANETVNFTVTITDGPEVPPSVTVPVNQILLQIPTPLTANEGNAMYYDESRFDLDANGKACISGDANSYAWTTYGSTNLDAAKGKYFLFRWEPMGTTITTEGLNFGNLLTKSGLDRDGNGEIGVRGGVSSAIDPNEGFRFGMDLTSMASTIKMQLSAIKFNYLTSAKQVTIVNRNNVAKRKVLSTNGFVDVRDLNIIAIGGANYPDIASFFNSGTTGNAFRLAGFKFDVLANSASQINNLTTQNETLQSRDVVIPSFVNENLVIKYRNPSNSKVKICIFNTAGNCVYNNMFTTFGDNDIEVKFDGVKSGIYMCQLIDNEGVMVKKIIKE